MKCSSHAIVALALALILCCSLPVTGVDTYLSEGPRMSASIAGTNEFSPGQDAVIAVVVQNRGLNIDKFVMTGTIARDDIPTTAKLVTVSLEQGASPVIIKSDPQVLGDLASQASATARISARITSDATEGEYTLPLTIRYKYLASSSQEQADVLESDYQWKSETIPITIRIKPSVKITVIEAVPENLGAGTSGFLDLKIVNTGFEDGKKATVRLIRNGNSPVIPTDASVYIGDFVRNQTVTCRYRVSVSGDAENQTYPVDVAVTYENRDGEIVTSAIDTAGIPVGAKLKFAVISDPISVPAGSDQVITVKYRNTGSRTAYGAQARVSAVEPFSSSDNTAYLGDLKPGDVSTAAYRLTSGNSAVPGDYALDTEIRFRDALDNSQISDTFKVGIHVEPPSRPSGVATVLPFVGAGALVIVAGYYLLVLRRRK